MGTSLYLLKLPKFSQFGTIHNFFNSENTRMTHLKEPYPRIICSETKCYAPNHPNRIKREREVTPLLENEREEWMRILFKGGNSFYNIPNVQDEMLTKTRSLWYI
jgi:hypothetical protein